MAKDPSRICDADIGFFSCGHWQSTRYYIEIVRALVASATLPALLPCTPAPPVGALSVRAACSLIPEHRAEPTRGKSSKSKTVVYF